MITPKSSHRGIGGLALLTVAVVASASKAGISYTDLYTLGSEHGASPTLFFVPGSAGGQVVGIGSNPDNLRHAVF